MLFTSRLDLNIRKKLVQYYIWSTLCTYTYILTNSFWRNKLFSVLKCSLLDLRRGKFYFPVGKRFSSSHKIPDHIQAHPVSFSMRIICPFPLPESARVVKISTYFHLELRSRGSIPPFPYLHLLCTQWKFSYIMLYWIKLKGKSLNFVLALEDNICWLLDSDAFSFILVLIIVKRFWFHSWWCDVRRERLHFECRTNIHPCAWRIEHANLPVLLVPFIQLCI